MEYLQIYNQNRKKIDEKIERKKKRTLTGGKHYKVALIFIENSKHEFLVQFTSEEKHHEFAITGGHVTYGDNSLTTAIKETEEEMGIKLVKDELSYIDTIDDPLCFCDIYYTKKDIPLNKMKLQKEEVEYVDWFSIDEINQLIDKNKFRKKNIVPLKRLLESI